MSDTDTTSAATETAPVPVSDFHSIQSDAIAAVKDTALHAMAKDDSAEDYIKERRHRDAEDAGDESVDKPSKRAERVDRFKRALERAQAEGGHEAAAGASDQREGGETDYRVTEREVELAKKAARYEMRAAEFAKENPDYHAAIQGTFSVYKPAEHIAGAILESPVGPAMALKLADHPDAIEELNNLPPEQAARYLGLLEGRIIEQQVSAAARPGLPSTARRLTKAPPPMSRIGGGASPPSRGLNDVAKSDDASEYVRMRRQQGAS